ncbi:hypothetical protein RhiirC2_794428 [Rhizophagus irregularis]|uniref:Uncharacterized protein n=1 Tax=Rhizophagus irregularis TaxID=588596 RepID=A0A2N1MDJ8_9GLOM|nr:hypothetical protein RhiirC2_794428 [Rhizophagus irregularis]
MNLRDIKKRCSWKTVKTLDDKEIGEQDFILVKKYIKRYGGQDEIIGKDGKFIKLWCGNSIVQDNALPLSEDEQFEDALMSPKLKQGDFDGT